MTIIIIIACIIVICGTLWFVSTYIFNYLIYYHRKEYASNLKKKTVSFSNIMQLDDCEDIDESTYNSIIPIQKRSNECFRCSQRLYNYRKKINYFAYDSELCETCWYKATRNINNNKI